MVDFSTDIKACVAVLQSGGSILYPTDTIWGIGCDASNAAAVDRVFDIKNRPREKSMIILLPDARDIFQYVAAPPPDIISMLESFDRPTTVIFNTPLHLAENALAADGSVAIRIPEDPFCKALLKRFGKPIISTSANRSGDPSAATFPEIHKEIVEACDYVVRHRQDDRSIKAASRILAITDSGTFRVIRA